MFLRKRATLFSRSRSLEAEIDEFLDKLSESSMTYQIAISSYLTHGPTPAFDEMVQRLAEFESRPEPDLLWIQSADYRERHPSASDVKLAIEVSDSSLKSDLREKAELYAEAGIVEYWIVDASASCVHVFRNPQGKEYTDRSIANRGDKISPIAAEGAVLAVSDLFGTE